MNEFTIQMVPRDKEITQNGMIDKIKSAIINSDLVFSITINTIIFSLYNNIF
jgi:hypothetical protein